MESPSRPPIAWFPLTEFDSFYPSPVIQTQFKSDEEEKLLMIRNIAEDWIQEDDLRNLILNKPVPLCYDISTFEFHGRMPIAQGVLKAIDVNKLTCSGCKVKIWITDWFDQLNKEMRGDAKTFELVGQYYIELWKSAGMNFDEGKVEFLWSDREINVRAHKDWRLHMDIVTTNNSQRIERCDKIMDGSEQDEETAAQSFRSCIQCADILLVKADTCQLGMDHLKPTVLTRKYCDDMKRKNNPIIVPQYMLPALRQSPELLSRIGGAFIYMDDEEFLVNLKIKLAYCPDSVVGNPCLEYVKFLIFPYFKEFKVERSRGMGGTKIYKNFEEVAVV